VHAQYSRPSEEREHDVKETRDVVLVWEAWRKA
jgi:dihydropteroate synthase